MGHVRGAQENRRSAVPNGATKRLICGAALALEEPEHAAVGGRNST
jgi:hypothetical protein